MLFFITLVVALITIFFTIPFGMVPAMYLLYAAYILFAVSDIKTALKPKHTGM